jgi:hypothetical protein
MDLGRICAEKAVEIEGTIEAGKPVDAHIALYLKGIRFAEIGTRDRSVDDPVVGWFVEFETVARA